jgi:methionine salvage enolase-phosphatase E1
MYVLQLFLDDNVKNVVAGKEMGLHTVLVILQTKVKLIIIKMMFIY